MPDDQGQGSDETRAEPQRTMDNSTTILESELRRARDEAARYRNERNELREQMAKLEEDHKATRSEVETAKQEAERIKAERDKAAEWEEKYKAEQEKQRTMLLEQLPEDKRERYETFDLEALRTVTADLAETGKPAPHSQAAGKPGDAPDETTLDLSKMTPEEISELPPETYEKLMSEHVKKSSSGGFGNFGGFGS